LIRANFQRELFLAGICLVTGRLAPADDVEHRLAIHRRDELPPVVDGGDEVLARLVARRVEPEFLGERRQLIRGISDICRTVAGAVMGALLDRSRAILPARPCPAASSRQDCWVCRS
jgi:hypothetical protein